MYSVYLKRLSEAIPSFVIRHCSLVIPCSFISGIRSAKS
ncbi:hypothetical protein D1AOALGA4SA_7910 [Olavius algarvensis Delta 1 endosymbiont]|nr:hypothetical protein D1AOALGA4SA_7910 [Olavius algarvensis Delta 1 endosymbiont]